MTEFLDYDFWLCDVMDDLSKFLSEEARLLRAASYIRTLMACYNRAEVDLEGVEFGKVLTDSVLRGYYNYKQGVLCVECSECTYSDECSRYEFWRRLYSSMDLKSCKVRMGSFLRIYTDILTVESSYELGIYAPEIFEFS